MVVDASSTQQSTPRKGSFLYTKEIFQKFVVPVALEGHLSSRARDIGDHNGDAIWAGGSVGAAQRTLSDGIKTPPEFHKKQNLLKW